MPPERNPYLASLAALTRPRKRNPRRVSSEHSREVATLSDGLVAVLEAIYKDPIHLPVANNAFLPSDLSIRPDETGNKEPGESANDALNYAANNLPSDFGHGLRSGGDKTCDGRSMNELKSLINIVHCGGVVHWDPEPLIHQLVWTIVGYGYCASDIQRINIITKRISTDVPGPAPSTTHFLDDVRIEIHLAE